MSFISVKNFAAPITNRVNLIALLLCIILFAVFRLSGGRIEMRPIDSEAQHYRDSGVELYESDSKAARLLGRSNPGLLQGDNQGQAGGEVRELNDDIFQSNRRAASNQQGTAGSKSAKGLDEIEQMLGRK